MPQPKGPLTKETVEVINRILTRCAIGVEECERQLQCEINAKPEMDELLSQAATVQKIKELYFPGEP